MVVMIVTVVMMAMVCAAFWRRRQLAVQIGSRQLFHRRVRKSGANFDALLREQIQGAPPNAARDDNIRALFAQPAREKSRCVWRRRHWSNAYNFPLFGIGLHECESFAATKVSVKPAFGGGNGDGNHGCLFSFVVADGAVATSSSWLHPLVRLIFQPQRRNWRAKSARPFIRRGCVPPSNR